MTPSTNTASVGNQDDGDIETALTLDPADATVLNNVNFDLDDSETDHRVRFSNNTWSSIKSSVRNLGEQRDGSGRSGDDMSSDDEVWTGSDAGAGANNAPKQGSFKYKSPSSSAKQRKKKKPNKLTVVSKMYDLDGDGILDEAEQAMRDRDVSNKGQLSNEQIYEIVQEQLKSKKDVNFMKKSILGLAVFVVVLALTNFATSWASAVLAKDSKTDANRSTLLVKNTEEIMGLQSAGETFEMTPLDEEERRARRALVIQEMMDDSHGDDHAHRKLGKKNKKNNVCGCESLAFDSGKVSEDDLVRMKVKCDGSRTVNIKRKWRDGSYDIDTLCRPGVLVAKKGPKNKKTRRVEYHFTYPGQSHNAVFVCEDSWCHGSGPVFAQGPNQPCDLTIDDECDVGLVCHASGNRKKTGTGICIRLDTYQKEFEACDPNLGEKACRDGLYCSVSNDPFARTGICTKSISVVAIPRRQRQGDACDLELGSDACKSGLICYASRKKKKTVTTGVCTVELRDESYNNFVILPGMNEVCYFSDGRRACAEGFTCAETTLTANRNDVVGYNDVAASNGGSVVGSSGSIAWNSGGGTQCGPSGCVQWGNGGGASLRSATGICTRVRNFGSTNYYAGGGNNFDSSCRDELSPKNSCPDGLVCKWVGINGSDRYSCQVP